MSVPACLSVSAMLCVTLALCYNWESEMVKPSMFLLLRIGFAILGSLCFFMSFEIIISHLFVILKF